MNAFYFIGTEENNVYIFTIRLLQSKNWTLHYFTRIEETTKICTNLSSKFKCCAAALINLRLFTNFHFLVILC